MYKGFVLFCSENNGETKVIHIPKLMLQGGQCNLHRYSRFNKKVRTTFRVGKGAEMRHTEGEHEYEHEYYSGHTTRTHASRVL